jgi:hypothetical protein
MSNTPFARKNMNQPSLRKPVSSSFQGDSNPLMLGTVKAINANGTVNVLVDGGIMQSNVMLPSSYYVKNSNNKVFGSFSVPPIDSRVVIGWIDGTTPYIIGSIFPLNGLEELKVTNDLINALLPPDLSLKYKTDGSLLLLAGNDLTLDIDRSEKTFKLNIFENNFSSADDSLVLTDKHGNKIELNEDGVTIKSASDKNITLDTVDSSLWIPNILQFDPLTGLPHGGAEAGLSHLKGAGALKSFIQKVFKRTKNSKVNKAVKASGMNGRDMGIFLMQKVNDYASTLQNPNDLDRESLYEVMGEAIVQYIQQNAVLVVDSGIPVSTTGTAAAQSGSTTANGTGTIL